MDELLKNYIPLHKVAWAKYEQEMKICEEKNNCRKHGDVLKVADDKPLFDLLEIQQKSRNAMLKKIFDLEYKLGLVEPELQKRLELLRKANNEKSKKKTIDPKKSEKKDVKNCRFVTLNFDDAKIKPILHELPNLVKEYVDSHRYIKDCKFTIEQRLQDDTLSTRRGVHIHILLNTTKNINRRYILDSLWSFCKDYMSDEAKIDFEYVKTKTHKFNCEEYLKGNKVDEDKIKKVEVDNIWRLRNGFERIYTKST